jgi:hypothetical protein
MFQIGIASRNIAPKGPAMVQGQKYVRIATGEQDPIMATAMAIQGNRADGAVERAVLVSFDIALVTSPLEVGLRREVTKLIPGLAPESIVLTATHTHDSIVMSEGAYPPQAPEILTPTQCINHAVEQATQAVVEAFAKLAPCKIGRGFGHAVVAHNRRPVYEDGTAQMYGNPARKEFRWIEGPEDHTLDMFFVWDTAGKLSGVVIDVPCPSQAEEHLKAWSSDYWHEVRLEIKKRLGQEIWVFPLCGVSGDQSPHSVFDKAQEKELLERRGVSERQEIADRICDGVERALKYAKPMAGDVVFAHDVRKVEFAPRKISQKERDWHEKQYNWEIKEMDPRLWWPTRLKAVVEIFDGKKQVQPLSGEVHVFRIGDAVLATNPFELYTDFGLQIKARSTAPQTFLVQLTGPYGFYLPTQRGVDGGGYGSIPVVSVVGPEGGQQLVEVTLEMIEKQFPKPAAK